MKKLLGTALCVALVVLSGSAGAELLKNLKVGGGLDIQMNAAANVADFSTNRENQAGGAGNNDRLNDALTRTWLGLSWDLLDDVHARATLRKNDRSWGTAGGAGQGAGTSQAISAPGGQSADLVSNINVDEANIKVDKLLGSMDATLGRQFYGNPGDLVIYFGPKDAYGMPVTALDALRVDHSCDWMNLSGLAGKIVGHAAGAGSAADVDVRGLDMGWKNLPVKANTFLWNRVVHGVGALGQPPSNNAGFAAANLSGVNDDLYVYGVKVRGDAMGGWAALTVAANGGTDRVTQADAVLDGASNCGAGGTNGCPAASSNYSGKAVMLDLGYKHDVPDMAGLTPWFNWAWGSGRSSTLEKTNEGFTSIASDYRPGVIYGRFSSAGLVQLGGGAAAGLFSGTAQGADYNGNVGVSQAGLNNRIIWGLGMKANPANWNRLTAGLSYWDFNYQRATYSSRTAGPQAVGNRHIGSEFDLQFDWAHSENVMLSAGWAAFQPGGFVKETIRSKIGAPGVQEGNNPVTLAFADFRLKF